MSEIKLVNDLDVAIICLKPKYLDIYKKRQQGTLYRIIAEEYGVSPSRIREIYCTASRKIRFYKGKNYGI
jgi:DNA-directed RNA polymerase sigma subunit (sigma70/sigma32)